MKKILLSAVLALMAITTVFASSKVKEVVYTSTSTGISFQVPSNCNEVQDDVTAVILQTPDEEYTFVAEAFNLDKTSKQEMSDHLIYMAEAAKIDLEQSERIETETENVTLVGEAIDYDNGGAAAVGLAFVKGTKLGYYITVVASPRYVDFAVSSLVTVSFDPDAVE